MSKLVSPRFYAKPDEKKASLLNFDGKRTGCQCEDKRVFNFPRYLGIGVIKIVLDQPGSGYSGSSVVALPENIAIVRHSFIGS